MNQWYLVTTKLKSERRVKENLQVHHNLETFFPVYPPKKASSPIGLPLFPRYIFVHFNVERDYRHIQYTPGVSRIVTFGDTIIPIPDDVIVCLRDRCNARDEIAPPSLTAGQKVTVKKGIFDGCEGIIREKRGNRRVQLLLDLAFGNELKVEVDASEIEPATRPLFHEK